MAHNATSLPFLFFPVLNMFGALMCSLDKDRYSYVLFFGGSHHIRVGFMVRLCRWFQSRDKTPCLYISAAQIMLLGDTGIRV